MVLLLFMGIIQIGFPLGMGICLGHNELGFVLRTLSLQAITDMLARQEQITT